jgi:hypothetical protein
MIKRLSVAAVKICGCTAVGEYEEQRHGPPIHFHIILGLTPAKSGIHATSRLIAAV